MGNDNTLTQLSRVIKIFSEEPYRDIFLCALLNQMIAHRRGNKTHAYSAQRSGSKKYAKAERRKRNKPKA